MASITFRNLDADTAEAVRRCAAESGRTLAEELQFMADSVGIAGKAVINESARPERELTGEEKLALVREVRAKQTKVWPCCVPLVRRVRREQAAHAEAKTGFVPTKKTAARNAPETRPPRAQ